jgi:hypothetical protein
MTVSIWAAVSPRAPARAMASAIAMLVGERTTLASGLPARPRRSRPKALMAAEAFFASAGAAAARGTSDIATSAAAAADGVTARDGSGDGDGVETAVGAGIADGPADADGDGGGGTVAHPATATATARAESVRHATRCCIGSTCLPSSGSTRAPGALSPPTRPAGDRGRSGRADQESHLVDESAGIVAGARMHPRRMLRGAPSLRARPETARHGSGPRFRGGRSILSGAWAGEHLTDWSRSADGRPRYGSSGDHLSRSRSGSAPGR